MKLSSRRPRLVAACIGIGALATAIIAPGSIANSEISANTGSSGDVEVEVFRAVGQVGDADGNVDITQLRTQMSVAGSGEAQFSVPVAEGGSPKNSTTLGSPEMSDGSAQYDITVDDGVKLLETSQSYDGDIPVTLSTSATLDGQPLKISEVAGKTGLVQLTYTIENTTSKSTEVKYKDVSGNEKTKTEEIPIPMAAQLSATFPGTSWSEVTSNKNTAVISDNGSGGIQYSVTQPLVAESLPNSNPKQTIQIEARVENAVIPPVEIKTLVLGPQQAAQLENQKATPQGLTPLLGQATKGAELISDKTQLLGTSLSEFGGDIAPQLVNNLGLVSGGLDTLFNTAIPLLEKTAKNLPEQVTSSKDYDAISGGFKLLDSSIQGVIDGIGDWTNPLANGPGNQSGPYLTKAGDLDTSKATLARGLWSLIYGVRSQDIPRDSAGKAPAEDIGGLTNPDCDQSKNKGAGSKDNPCGAWQAADQIKKGLTGTAVPAIAAISDGHARLT